MKFYSTKNHIHKVDLREAIYKGIADDGGLFLPEEIPPLPSSFFEKSDRLTFKEIAFEASHNLLKNDLPKNDLKDIICRAIDFDAPLVRLNEDINILELFHGPTLAFKDFGARFMAELLSYFNNGSKKEVTILVATSGDTGSAVANGFYETEGINIIILYPSQKVSIIQEKQLTTLGKNITALEVKGSFDDCQRLVKSAFADSEIKSKLNLSSANSINFARLLPQSFYYFYAYAQLKRKQKKLIFSVPSGNFGNLTGGIIAKKMGLPVSKFIAALNSNDVFLRYLKSGIFRAKPSVKTISNAMDVGNPSNFARVFDIYNKDHILIKEEIYAASFNDSATIEAIKEVRDKFNYIVDPHGAVGYLALNKYIGEKKLKDYNGIILETAHPAKFSDIMEDALNYKIPVPERLKKSLEKEKESYLISNKFEDFKEFLINHS